MKQKILKILIIASILFIWGHSAVPAEKSAKESGLILRILSYIFGGERLTDHIVRKLAHFTEYAVLGFFLSCYKEKLCSVLSAGLFVSFIDETIQLFAAGRSGEVVDMWIDLSGIVLAACITEGIRKWKSKENGL